MLTIGNNSICLYAHCVNSKQRAPFKKRLLEMRQALVEDGVKQAEPMRSDPDGGVDEDAQPLSEMSQVIASNRNRARSASLDQIDSALGRIQDDPEYFGLCADCEEPIALRRLELAPHAEYCVACQSKRDEERGGRRRGLTGFR